MLPSSMSLCARLTLSGSYGTNDRGKQFSAARKAFSPDFVEIHFLPQNILSKRSIIMTISRQREAAGSGRKRTGSYRWSWFEPGILFEQENRRITNKATDSLIDGSFGFNSIAPRFSAKDVGGVTLSSSFEWRNDDAFWLGAVKRQSHSLTQSYGAEVKETHNFSSSVLVVAR